MEVGIRFLGRQPDLLVADTEADLARVGIERHKGDAKAVLSFVFGGGSWPLVRRAVKVNVCARTGTADTSSSRPRSGASRAPFAHLGAVILTGGWQHWGIGVLLSFSEQRV
jgi:hypothetical protein